MACLIEKIVSGGQAGADRGGLDAALARGILHGGYCPRGRRAEDGVIPARYQLEETAASNYSARTVANIKLAHVTIVFMGFSSREAMRFYPGTPGSLFTLQAAREMGKPTYLERVYASADQRLDEEAIRVAAFEIARGLKAYHANGQPVSVVNVAGSRESKCPGIQRWVRDCMTQVIIALGG